MIWETIRGQSRPIEFLRRSAAAGRLAHALLFVGPPGVGKGLVARTLATSLLCERFSDSQLDACGECPSCRMMRAGTHPDFLLVACPEGKSELPIELLVGSRENRGREGLCHDLSLRPMAGGRRIAVIEDAERMSTESANALLKTLEEPPSYAVLILVATDSADLLPTIRSRCQMVRFSVLSPDIVAQLARALEWAETDEEAQAAAALSGGSLTVVQQLLNPELRAVRAALFDALGQPRIRSHAISQGVLASLDKLGGDTQRQRTNAQWIVRFAIEFLQRRLRQRCLAPGDEGLSSEPVACETLGEAIERCVDAEQQLAANVSIPLCLEALFSDLATILDQTPLRN